MEEKKDTLEFTSHDGGILFKKNCAVCHNMKNDSINIFNLSISEIQFFENVNDTTIHKYSFLLNEKQKKAIFLYLNQGAIQ